MFFDFIQPDRDGEETFFVSEVKNHNYAIGTLVVGIRDCAVPFLTRCVPNLQLDSALIDLECSESEINSNCADVVLLEAIVLYTSNTHSEHQSVTLLFPFHNHTYRKSDEQTRFPHVSITDQNHFK